MRKKQLHSKPRLLIRTFPFLAISLLGFVLLTACSAINQATPTPEPVVQEDFNPIVSATGLVLPAQYATLSLGQPGKIESVFVEEGDQVDQGDLLVMLEEQLSREALEANVEAAQLALLSAEQDLDLLYENNAMLASQAQLTLANARDEVDDAEYRWRVRQEGNRASTDTINAAKANLVLADKEVEKAQDLYDDVSGKPEDDPRRALALSNLVAAKNRRDDVLRQLNWYTGRPTDIDQAILDAEVAIAQAMFDEAQREWETLKDGPDPDDVALLEARVANAQAQLVAAEAALADLEPNLELRAPFSGTVTEVYVNEREWINPGQPVLLLADLEQLRIETTDLSEIDVAQISVGDMASVTFDALVDVVIPAQITRIANKSTEGSGVNYTVILAPDSLPERLRWGMTAFVDIEIDS